MPEKRFSFRDFSRGLYLSASPDEIPVGSAVRNRGALRQEWRLNRGSILVCGVLGIFGYFLILVAFSLERVSYVVGLRQISIVFSVLLGAMVLKERHVRQRMFSALLIFIGVFLIAGAG